MAATLRPIPTQIRGGTSEAPGSAQRFWDFLGNAYVVNDPNFPHSDDREELVRSLVFDGPRRLTESEVAVLGAETRFDIGDTGQPINPFSRYVKVVRGNSVDPDTGDMRASGIGLGGEGYVGLFGLKADELFEAVKEMHPGVVEQYVRLHNR